MSSCVLAVEQQQVTVATFSQFKIESTVAIASGILGVMGVFVGAAVVLAMSVRIPAGGATSADRVL